MTNSNDPLEDIYGLDEKTKLAVVISVLRTTRSSQDRIERKLEWVLRAMWSLVAAIIVGIVVALTTSHQPRIQPHANPTKATPVAVVRR